MKQTASLSIKIILIITGVFYLSNTYGQDANPTVKTVFGKLVTSKNPKNGLVRCATTEYEQYLQEKDPKRMSNTQFEAWLTPLVKKYKANRINSKTAATVVIIPVVVHVIHSGQDIGVAPNITDEQVISQITVLNQDYRKMLGTPGGTSTNPVAADVEIQFVLAQQDPNGNPTNGIDRVSLCESSWSEIDINSTLKPATIWDPNLYMNMWSLKFTDNTLLGYAQFPDNNFSPSNPNYLEGLDTSGGPSSTDGVVSSYDVFGSSNFGNNFFLVKPYDKGRTMTHEVGHWLGLRHIWGDGGSRDKNTKDCTASDYCADTPQSGWENYECVTSDSCPAVAGNDMIENYMDYTNDECMNIFTQNQKERIVVIMNNAARRSSLKTSTKGAAITLVSNDVEVKLYESCPISICGGVTNQTTKTVVLYNRGTTTLTSAKLNYSINGGSNVEYNWSGTLATNKYATFNVIINSTSNGFISVSVVTANGVTDQRSSNNAATGTYIVPNSPTNYTFNTYKFTLQQDYFGSETTWNIKDGSGVIKFSGGPYTDTYVDDKSVSAIPALITQTWTLDNNQCYTFTINDSAGDGICCGSGLGGSGNGSYSIKSTDDAITIKSGSSFTSKQSISFTTNTLATLEFENSNDIFMYPNPTKNTLNIRVSDSFGIPNNYIIYNNLGQIIAQKKVLSASDLTINTSSLSNGVYYITVEKDDHKKSIPFIKE
ncbi:M43 family zinc metalloprotease [Flavobacterium cellulosilyticum]|uniref:T9SS type A sorting domain-containing protein n=1 Tax=Flavobacterium cellulosilyticum TaxID=2541731 RepID=A0A4R5CKA6_9FLAO|nr:M43 family zinc metalloprotease [Flavobacterium cellulosilyticum]TDD99599.1 T9SS type A sorting domain-containing protein [Flavobacterium cellulosilyticum]